MSYSKRLLHQNESSSVVDWYNGRSVFVTGGTGFLGKVLLEKMLRALPGLQTIYILVRPKKGLSPSTRIQDIVKLPIFEKLRETSPHLLKKLVAIEGDVTAENLGMSNMNEKILYGSVSVVFHAAATLRMEADLRDSIMYNVMGTDNVFKFSKRMKNLAAFVHLSTAFCHCDVDILEERTYEPTRNPKDIMNLVSWMDKRSLDLITPSLIEPHPNTYTFTKRLAESIAESYSKEMPVTILRPSIVIPVLKEPLPGWVDSLNGPVGVIAGAGKGVIRSMLVEANNHAEIVPADIAVNGMITVAWYRATRSFTDIPVYNMTQSDVHPITWGQVLDKGRKQYQDYPFDWPLWYPDGDIRTNKLLHNIIVFLFQFIPAYFMDIIFMLVMQKTFLVRIQKKIRLGMKLLQYFTLREWKFKNNKFLAIGKAMNEKDVNIFYIDNVEFDEDLYLREIILGTRKYCLKEDLKSLPRARLYLKFLYVLDRIAKGCILLGLFWLILQVSNVCQAFHARYYGLTGNV